MIAESGKYDGPIVVFPEIARTNGKGVLKFSQWYGDETSSSAQMLLDRAHVVAFKFPNQTNSPAQPMETRMGALCRVFDASLSYMEISRKLVVFYKIQIHSLLGLKSIFGSRGAKDQKKSPEAMRDVMARMMGAKCVDLDVSQYCDFYDYCGVEQ